MGWWWIEIELFLFQVVISFGLRHQLCLLPLINIFWHSKKKLKLSCWCWYPTRIGLFKFNVIKGERCLPRAWRVGYKYWKWLFVSFFLHYSLIKFWQRNSMETWNLSWRFLSFLNCSCNFNSSVVMIKYFSKILTFRNQILNL